MSDQPDSAKPGSDLELCLGVFERREGIPDVGIKAGAAGVETREDRGAHAGIPEFSDVLGDARHRLVVALAVKEFSDLISHMDQPVRRHERLLARRYRPQFA